MDVSTSMSIPISEPASTAIWLTCSRFSGLSTHSLMSAIFASEASRRNLLWDDTSDVTNMSRIPPSTITSASATLAAQTPFNVPPASICLCIMMGLLIFLACCLILQILPAYVLAMTSKLWSIAGTSINRLGVDNSIRGSPILGLILFTVITPKTH